MWRGKTKGDGALHVVISVRRIEYGVRTGDRWHPDCFGEALLPAPADAAALLDVLAELGEALRRTQESASTTIGSVNVVMADTWLSAAAVPWSDSLQQAESAHAYCRSQLASGGSEPEPDDVIVIDDAPYGEPRMAMAFPARVLLGLQGLAGALGAVLESVRPLSVAAWLVGGGRRRRALAVIDEGLLLMLHGERELADVMTRGLPEGESELQGVQSHWRRLQLRDPQIAALGTLELLNLLPAAEQSAASDAVRAAPGFQVVEECGASRRLQFAVAQSTHHRAALDAIGRHAPMSPLRAALAVFAVVFASVVASKATQAFEERRSLSRQLSALEVRPSIAKRAPSYSREDVARVRAVNAAVGELNFPVNALLHALRPPADIHVAVLSLDLSGATAKLVAEAPDSVDMTKYASFVGDRRPFSGAHLLRHEIVETSPQRPYRFTVEATWAP